MPTSCAPGAFGVETRKITPSPRDAFDGADVQRARSKTTSGGRI